jgi:hypothetical protein
MDYIIPTMEESVPGASPDSIPSLAESSVDTHDIAKVLFHTPTRDSKLTPDHPLTKFFSPVSHNSDESEGKGPRYGCDNVASLDLAINTASLLSEEFKRRTSRRVDVGSISCERDNATPSPLRGNSNVNNLRNCSDSAEAHLASLVSMFDAMPQKPSLWANRAQVRSVPKAPLDADETLCDNASAIEKKVLTYGGWQAKTESLERECVALKEIMRVDSTNILKLKSSMERLNDISKQHLAEIEVLRARLCSTQRQLELSERDRDDKDQREVVYEDAIEILKNEINRLVNENVEASDPKETKRLQFENELFAAQIIQNEEEVTKLWTTLAMREAEIEELMLQLEDTKIESSLLDELLALESGNGARELKGEPGSGARELKGTVDSLIVKLAKAEEDRQAVAHSYQYQLNKKDEQICEIKTMVEGVMKKQENVEVGMPCHLFEKEEKIEILSKTLIEREAEIEHLKDKTAKKKEEQKRAVCSPFSMFSEC